MAKMCSIWSIFVALILLVSCKADPTDEDYDLLEKLTNPNNDRNLADDLSDLRRNVTSTLSDINQQGAVLMHIIDILSKKEKPNTEITCDLDSFCVKKAHCKSEKPNSNGHYEVTFRQASNGSPCHYLQVCCHKDNMIEPTIFPDSTEDDDFPMCGTRHSKGINMTLTKSPNGEAEFGEFPWMVALMITSEQNQQPELIGGGSILAPNIVLTSAYKVHNIKTNELMVRAGEWDLETELEIYPHIDRAVQQVIIHENYIPDETDFNIALLVLKLPLSSNPHIAPICLPSSIDNIDPSGCFVTGWGKREFLESDYPHVLKEIALPLVPRDICTSQLATALNRDFKLDDSSICAGGVKGADACLGDGGAPLVCPIKGMENRYYQVGFVAWGYKCGEENVPGVYTNVDFMMPWITQALNKLNISSRYYTEAPKIIYSFPVQNS